MNWMDILKAPVWDVKLPKGKYFTLSKNKTIDKDMSYGFKTSWGKFTSMTGKPKGLWFSFTDKFNWADWLKWNEPRWAYNYEYLITFDISGNVLIIEDKEKFQEIASKYSISHGETQSTLDWAALSKKYDAVIFEYTERQWNEADAAHMWIDTLDVDSGVVWNLDAITNERVYAHRKLTRGHRRSAKREVPYDKEQEHVERTGMAHGDWVIE